MGRNSSTQVNMDVEVRFTIFSYNLIGIVSTEVIQEIACEACYFQYDTLQTVQEQASI